ncbi:MAG: efflux RND transporter periplasmic adaptor subunit [Opitutaceae bacterium]
MAKSRGFGSLIIIVLLLAAAGWGGYYYWNKKSDKQPEFQTTKVSRGEIRQVVTATGDLQSVTQVDVSSQVSGLVVEVMVDFNTPVKTGQVLARLDPATYESKLKAAQADLSSTEASNTLQRLNTERIRGLRKDNLVSQQELDQGEALLKQSDAQLATRQSAVDDAKVNLQRCTIYSPIDGIVLSRLTDKGRTVSASTSAPTLFVIVNDLTKMQIAAAVAEADIGSIANDQDVTFTVDAFPNVPFRGKVSQVRNAAKVTSSVVSYDTIIAVNNDNQRLKPGMTANVSIVIAQKPDVLRVANSALRVRLPAELQPKTPAAPAAAGAKGSPMTDEEKRMATTETFREAGYQQGSPLTPEIIEKAKTIGKAKGVDEESITAFATRMAGRGQGGGRQGGGGGGRRGGGGGDGGGADRGFTNAVVTRPVFRLVDPTAKDKKIEQVMARFGISDGFTTEVIEGLSDGDTLVTSVTMPGAPAPLLQQQGAGGANPFQQGGGRGGAGGGGGARGMR